MVVLVCLVEDVPDFMTPVTSLVAVFKMIDPKPLQYHSHYIRVFVFNVGW